jgi:hypothetical protein
MVPKHNDHNKAAQWHKTKSSARSKMLLKAGVNLLGSEFLQKRDDIWNRLCALTNNFDLHVGHRIDATDEVNDTSAVCSCSNEHAVKGNVMKPLGCRLFEVDDIVCVRAGVQLNLDVKNLLFVVPNPDEGFSVTKRNVDCRLRWRLKFFHVQTLKSGWPVSVFREVAKTTFWEFGKSVFKETDNGRIRHIPITEGTDSARHVCGRLERLERLERLWGETRLRA